MKNKRRVLTSIGVILSLSLFGCSSSNQSSDNNTEKTDAEIQKDNNSSSSDEQKTEISAVSLFKEALEKNQNWKDYGEHSSYTIDSQSDTETNKSENEMYINTAFEDGKKYSLSEVVKMNSVINGVDYSNSANVKYTGNQTASDLGISFMYMADSNPNTYLTANENPSGKVVQGGALNPDYSKQYLYEEIYDNKLEETEDGYTISFTLKSADKLNEFYKGIGDEKNANAKINSCSYTVKIDKDGEIKEDELNSDFEYKDPAVHEITTLITTYYGINKDLCDIQKLTDIIGQAPDNLVELTQNSFEPFAIQVDYPDDLVKHQ